MATYIPMGDRILVRRLEPKAKEGKIIIPDIAKERPQEGIVEAVGAGEVVKLDGRWVEKPMPVKVGDRVIFGKYTGIQILEDDELLICMTADDIICIVRK